MADEISEELDGLLSYFDFIRVFFGESDQVVTDALKANDDSDTDE